MQTTARPKLYSPRHPERTLLYQTVAEHYETWLELASAGQFDGQGDHHSPKPYVRQSVREVPGVRHLCARLCPLCGGQMRIIAFITHSADIRQILDHIVVDSQPPHITPARGPPLWDECDAHVGEGSQIGLDWDLVAQPAPGYEVDQRINW